MTTNSFKLDKISKLGMVDQNLVSYIKQQLAAGYDINAIKTAMLSYGYDHQVVEEAINATRPAAGGFPILPIAAIGVVVVIVIIGAFFLFRGQAEEKTLLDLKTTASINEVKAGDSLPFTIELINMGTIKRYDVSLVHQVTDSTGKIITSKQETMAVETRAGSSTIVPIPSNAATGTYKLTTSASYDGKTASSYFMFSVKGTEAAATNVTTPVTEKKCPASCDDNNICTSDVCDATTSYVCVHFPLTPCCGNNVCESGENYVSCSLDCKQPVTPTTPTQPTTILTIQDVITNAKDKAAANPDDAVSYCIGLEKDYHKDSCYNAVAEQTNSSVYCEKIISETSRDNCYTNFALVGDYTVCEKLVNQYLKASCISLSQANS